MVEKREIVIPNEDGRDAGADVVPDLLPKRSEGGLYIAAGFGLLLVSSTLAAVPGGYWPGYLAAFGFSLYGLLVAKGAAKRGCGVVVTGVSGGLAAGDFLVCLAQRGM